MLDIDHARLNSAHAAEGTLSEGKDVLATAGRALGEQADWLEWLLVVLDQLLSVRNLLKDLCSAIFTTTSRNEE